MSAPVEYIPDLIPAEEADAAFRLLDAELPWGRHDLPRDEVYFNDHPAPYTYGSPGRERTYMPEAEWHSVVYGIRLLVERALLALDTSFDIPMDVCFLNRYVGPRDQLGWHADDSPEMNPEACIVTVSLGAVRDITFRQVLPCGACGVLGRDHDPFCGMTVPWYSEVERLTLGHGSAAVMRPRMQETWQHRIPKSSVSDIGTRISLTFRGYLPEEARS